PTAIFSPAARCRPRSGLRGRVPGATACAICWDGKLVRCTQRWRSPGFIARILVRLNPICRTGTPPRPRFAAARNLAASRSMDSASPGSQGDPPVTHPAILALEDGTIFEGVSVGAPGLSVGEVVFNTAMTGYQEVLTDPSYARQLVTLTYPHIGNTGINDQDDESARVWAAGLIVRNVPRRPSSWRSQLSLPTWLSERGVVAIADIDTRTLTRMLSSHGGQSGALMAGDNIDSDKAIETARKFPGLKGMDLAKEVSTRERYEWTDGQLDLDTGLVSKTGGRFHVVAYDFGIKRNILRMLAERGCR